jgi:hypothetical protein
MDKYCFFHQKLAQNLEKTIAEKNSQILPPVATLPPLTLGSHRRVTSADLFFIWK